MATGKNRVASALRTGMITTLLVAATLAARESHAGRSPYDWAHIRLDYARREKTAQLRRFCDRLHRLAGQAASDKRVAAFFDLNHKAWTARDNGPIPDAVAKQIEALRRDFDGYYVKHYFAFYDVLFVSAKGEVFYTIRKETDLRESLKNVAGTPLADAIAARPTKEVFIDFHPYSPSKEPAAFFVEPMTNGDEPGGWIVLQCAINRVNALFATTQDLGRTGETFLVNRDGYMLTESQFTGAKTILEKQLSDRNIQAKFQAGQGRLTVTDYRGLHALTSFEVFEYLGAKWLIVAKMDEDEVTTSHYRNHRRYYGDRLLERIARDTTPTPHPLKTATDDRPTARIDMDEFLKAQDGERLETFGIASCTGLLAAWPGHFAYMAHVTPKDRLYGGDETDLLGQMTRKISNFDIYPSQKREIVFVVVAPHTDALLPIVERLTDEGFMLPQIRVLTRPDTRSATMTYDYTKNDLRATWRLSDGTHDTSTGHTLDDARNVGRIVQEIVREEESHMPLQGRP